MNTVIMKVVFFCWVLSSIAACGKAQDDLSAKDSKSAQADGTSATTTKAKSFSGVSGGYLQGYLVSAFDLSVDGKQYSDSESYYSEQLGRIENEVVDGGYSGYTLKFDAQIGLDDLKVGMKVYAVSVQSTGFAGDTRINDKGRFMLEIPAANVNDTYKIRTNKRISVTLTSADKKNVVKWCYNFSGNVTEASLDEPAIINTFTTKLTRYACQADSSGISIPAKAALTGDSDANN